MITSIWSTPEADAWSRDFGYEGYCNLVFLYKGLGKVTSDPVTEECYLGLCEVFSNEMIYNIGKDEVFALDEIPDS